MVSGAREFKAHKRKRKKQMKKQTKAKKPTQIGEKKPRSSISDMMRRDREACLEADKKLEQRGIKKPKRDLIKDDPCYGCRFALPSRDVNPLPFDRRFRCNGISRILLKICEAGNLIKAVSDYNPDDRAQDWSTKGTNSSKFYGNLVSAIRSLSDATNLIAARIYAGELKCLKGEATKECFCPNVASALQILENT